MTRGTDERWRTSYPTASFGCMQAIPEPEQGVQRGRSRTLALQHHTRDLAVRRRLKKML